MVLGICSAQTLWVVRGSLGLHCCCSMLIDARSDLMKCLLDIIDLQ